MTICNYGCNKEGKFQFKNGKSCCSFNANACPAKRNRDSVRKLGIPLPAATLEKARNSRLGIPSWSSGKTKDTNERLATKAAKVRERYLSGELVHIPIPHTKETKQRLSVIAKSRNFGGYVKGSGRGKKGWYKDIFCDSSWELAYVLWCHDRSKSIKRCTEKFPYEWEGSTRYYHPDFVVDGTVVEIKGYYTNQFKAKIEQTPIPILVIGKAEMVPILEYIVDKYGKNFVQLYENGG